MALIVDASVALMWIIDEPDSALARRWLSHNLIAPELVLSEMAHVLGKQIRLRLLTKDEAREGLTRARSWIAIAPTAHLAPTRVLDLAVKHQISAYDATYVALALELGCQFVTADRRLHNALALALPETMLWVGDAVKDDA